MNKKLVLALAGMAAASAMISTPAAARGSLSISIGTGGYGGYGYPSGYGSPYGYDDRGYRNNDTYRHQRQHGDLEDQHADEHDDLDEVHDEAHEQGLGRRDHRRLHRYLRQEHSYGHDELEREHSDEHRSDRRTSYRGY